MDSTAKQPLKGRLLSWVPGRTVLGVPRQTQIAPPEGVGRMTLASEAELKSSQRQGSTQVQVKSPTQNPAVNQPDLHVAYPKDAGAFSIKTGDVFMTRSMYEFLCYTIEILPGCTPEETRKVCKQLAKDMRELVK